ncbi:MAG: acyl carrier protein [Bacteroidales bacterium]|nr:acyl carrier protein [Bacteroidales bacterium]
MNREEIVEKVNSFLEDEFEVDPGLLVPGASFKKDLGIDSLDIVDIVVMVDSIFGVKIKSEDLGKILTLEEFYDFIEKKTA